MPITEVADNTPIFPTDVNFDTEEGPEFKTDLVILGSGWDKANIVWDEPLFRFDIGYGARTPDKVYTAYNFFMATKGRAQIFLVKCRLDFKSAEGNQRTATVSATDQSLGIATAGQTAFQAVKTYTVAGFSTTKTIRRLRAGTARISVDDTEETTGWTVDLGTGIFTRSSALTGGEEVKAGFEFYFACRFDDDQWRSHFRTWFAGETRLTATEVRE